MNSIYENFNKNVSFDSSKLDQLVQLGKDINEDVVTQLLQVHFETSEFSIAEMKSDFNASNFENLKRAAHKLKSSCGTLGLNKLHALCHGLENFLTDANESATVELYLAAIFFEYESTKEIIQSFNQAQVKAA